MRRIEGVGEWQSMATGMGPLKVVSGEERRGVENRLNR